ncbi:MAG: Fic family protein [Verrucomicrobiota bacterium]
MAFDPKFSISPAIAKALMGIEADRQAISELPLTSVMLQSLRESARLMSTHFSTQIEGNRLTEAQVREVMDGGGRFPGRERDEREVRCYFRALEYLEASIQDNVPISEKLIQRMHGYAFNGHGRATTYRDGQNVIRNSSDGGIVYMPPEAKDVPVLMRELVEWIIAEAKKDELPIPIIAGLVHYQFATIHPYYDGNGRTARLLTTYILHHYGYALKGIYSLDAYYARQLEDYYNALTIGGGHNYYVCNRAQADVTPFVNYFIAGMADSFANVRKHAEAEKNTKQFDQSKVLRLLSAQQRQILEVFRLQSIVNARQVAEYFKLSQRQANRYCLQWVEDGFLVIVDSSKRTRSYRLADEYEALFTE